MEQMKLLKMKKRISSIKFLLDYIYSELGSSKGKITKLITTAIKQSKIMHSEKIKDWTSITKKTPKKQNLSNFGDNIKQSNICAIGDLIDMESGETKNKKMKSWMKCS